MARLVLWYVSFRDRRGGETAVNDGWNNGVTDVIGVVQWMSPCDCEYYVTSTQVTAHRRLADRTVSTTLRQGHRRAAPLSGLTNSAAAAVHRVLYAAVAATVLSVDRGLLQRCERDNRTGRRGTPIVVHGRERDGRTVCRGRVRVRQSEHHRELSMSTVLV